MSTNKAGPVKVNGCGAIDANNKSEIIFIFFALHLSHTHSKKMWNQMVINYHTVNLFLMQYISPGRHKSRFYVEPFKEKNVTVWMNTVYIPNIDVKVWTHRSEFPQDNFLGSLTQTKISIQRPFELTDIDYDQIKDEIASI